MDRRRFFGTTASILTAFQANSLAMAQDALTSVKGRAADTVARDEDFWFNIRHAFTVDRNMINLNNGGVARLRRSSWIPRSAIWRWRT